MILTIVSRLPPSCSPILPRTHHWQPLAQEEVLRFRILPRHTTHLHLCHSTFPGPHTSGLATSLVPRLLLRCHLDLFVTRFLLFPRKGRPEEAAREASGPS